MRSLVSDLIPEYNKKLQFFFKETLAYVMEPPFSALLPPAHVCTINIQLYGKLSVLYHMETLTLSTVCTTELPR